MQKPAGRAPTLRRAADAHEDVCGRAGLGHLDGGRHVAVGDELDAAAGVAALCNQLRMPRPVQDDHRDITNGLACRGLHNL